MNGKHLNEEFRAKFKCTVYVNCGTLTQSFQIFGRSENNDIVAGVVFQNEGLVHELLDRG